MINLNKFMKSNSSLKKIFLENLKFNKDNVLIVFLYCLSYLPIFFLEKRYSGMIGF